MADICARRRNASHCTVEHSFLHCSCCVDPHKCYSQFCKCPLLNNPLLYPISFPRLWLVIFSAAPWGQLGVSTIDASLVVCVALLCKDSLAQRFKVNSMTSPTKFKLSGTWWCMTACATMIKGYCNLSVVLMWKTNLASIVSLQRLEGSKALKSHLQRGFETC